MVPPIHHLGHAGRTGPASAVWFDGELFGHPVEVLERRDELLRFYARVRESRPDGTARSRCEA